MNSFQIKYFLVLCRELNFVKASEELNITQQGLYKSIKALETELGVPLIIRDNGKVTLTSYGEYARSNLQGVLSSIEKTKSELAEMQRSNRRIISAAVLEGYCKDKAYTLEDILGPPPDKFKLMLHTCTYDEGIRLLEDDIVDFFIVKGPVDNRKLNVIDVAYERFFAVIPSGDPLAHNDIIKISDLNCKKLIIYNEKYRFYNNFFTKCKRYGFCPTILNTANEASAIFLPCILGEGIGIVPEFSVRTEMQSIGQIKIVPFEEAMDEEMCFSVLNGTAVPAYLKNYIAKWKQQSPRIRPPKNR